MERHTHTHTHTHARERRVFAKNKVKKFQQTKNSFGALQAEASVGSVSKGLLDVISTPGAGLRVQGLGLLGQRLGSLCDFHRRCRV
jgi:16S rRNA C1402 (ribose-2'-O) methylase RsmI